MGRVVLENGMLIAVVPALIWGGMLSWMDCRERRLPNLLTLGAAATALAWRLGYGDSGLFLEGFAGAVVGGLFLLIPFLMRGAGGGDVKMMFAAGAITGWNRVMMLLWITSLAGVVFGTAMLVGGKLDGARVKHLVRCIFDWRYDRRKGASGLPSREDDRVRVPFSIPITVGMIGAMLL